MSKDEKFATEALQAHERLHLLLKDTQRKDSEVFQKSISTLDNLREIKGMLDGSSKGFECPQVTEACLQDLKQLVLMHTPSSVTDEVQSKFQHLIFKAFTGTGKKILNAVLLTCPWYQACQDERGEQARHNILFVVFMSHQHQFLAPVNQHVLNEAFVIDKDWLYAVELYYFVHFLVKGKSRCIEVLYSPASAQLYTDDQWTKLKMQLHYSKLTGLKGYVEACKGQSVGGIGKKGKDGKFRLIESTSFRQFCDSFRLMHHLHNVIAELPPCTSIDNFDTLPSYGKLGMELIHKLYKDPDVSKRDIFNELVKWRDMVVEKLKGFQFTKQEEISDIVGKWQMETRLAGRNVEISQAINDDHSRLSKMMEEIGGPVVRLKPEQILLIARAGSYMYGLSTPSSDVDYLVIYKEPVQNILSRCTEIKDNFENRGPTLKIEYGAYEARLFCEMLMKGSVIILELVYADNHDYMSSQWKELSKQRSKFLTEVAIQQYLGLIRNNYKNLENEKHEGTPRDRKLLYQIFHKVDCVESIMKGQVPDVRCREEIKQYIMRVRTQPLEGDLERGKLVRLAKEKIDRLLHILAERESRLKENMDYELLTNWLMSVRGLSLENSLTSGNS